MKRGARVILVLAALITGVLPGCNRSSAPPAGEIEPQPIRSSDKGRGGLEGETIDLSKVMQKKKP